MFIILIQSGVEAPVGISCNIQDIHKVLGLLENHPAVTAYKIIGEIGLYTKENLKDIFPGYMAPNGKAVEQFVWPKE